MLALSYRRIVSLALPISLQALLTSSLSVVDIYMVSSLGAAAVAAVGLISKVYFVALLIAIGLSGGVSMLVAQYWGASDRIAVLGYLWAGLAWCGLAMLPLTLMALLFTQPMASLLSPDADVVSRAANYWFWTFPFAALSGFSFLLASVQRATGDTLWPMLASGLALLTNTGLNYLVLFGPFPLFNLGLAGVAYASVLSRLLELTLLVFLLRRHLQVIWVWSGERFWEVWRYGRVLMLNEGLWSAGIFAFFLVYAYMGATPLAAMSLMSPLENVIVDLFIGFGIAASILIGQHLGRHEFDEAYALCYFFLNKITLVSALLAAVLALMTPWVVAAFAFVEEPVRNLLVGVWLVYCIGLPVRTHNMLAVIGILRAGGDNRFVLLTETISLWLLAVPVSALVALSLAWPLWAVVGVTVLEELGKVAVFRWRIGRRYWLRNLTSKPDSDAFGQ
ncbi:MATE family efflux transporter [Saccharospirillum impatiens]|uniref:MATE family efflux transporter n=1 Tax=Saccharospirillum impatiens TaxID=169438 RepID=UPI0003F7FB22|nr:MATE family efflux transporter [Saccharospirillum impatiens]